MPEIIYRKLKDIKLLENNPRQIGKAEFDTLCKSVADNPDYFEARPLILSDRTGELVTIAGNMRYRAAKRNKQKEVPTILLSGLTEEREAEIIIRDNVNNGAWDTDILANSWTDYPLSDWGLDVPDFETVDDGEMSDAEPQIDKAAELNKKWKVQTGDLWQIGEHRLVCGDSTDAGCVSRLMDGERAELLFTSPPYSDQRDYEGDNLEVEHLVKFIPAFYPFCSYMAVNLGLKRQDNEINEYWQDYILEAKHSGYKFLSWNIWDRQYACSIAQQTAMFPIEHEWIFIFGQPKDLNKTIPNKLAGEVVANSTNRMPDGSLVKSSVRQYASHRPLGTILRTDIHRGDSPHPAMFPTDLPKSYVEAMTDVDEIVCDPFAGSGTTLVACENLGRKCYAIEISENYCAVILERMTQAFPHLEIKRVETAQASVA